MTTQNTDPNPRELTGGKFFAIMVTMFGIIISVNVFMAYSAISTFPGLVVKNSYVASQTFDERRAAQEALGLQFSAHYHEGTVKVSIDSLAAIPTQVEHVNIVVARPTHDRSDKAVNVTRVAGGFAGPVELERGAWVVRMNGVASDGTAFQHDMGLSIR